MFRDPTSDSDGGTTSRQDATTPPTAPRSSSGRRSVLKFTGAATGVGVVFGGIFGSVAHEIARPEIPLIVLFVVAILVLVPIAGFTVIQMRVLSKSLPLVQDTDEARALSDTFARSYSVFFLSIGGVSPAQPAVAAPSRQLPDGTVPTSESTDLAVRKMTDEGGDERAYPVDSFLAGLSRPQREALWTMAEPCVYQPGDVLVRQGQRAAYVVVILRGHAQITVAQGGRTTDLARRGPGDLVGERAVSRLKARSATVTALEELRGLRIGATEFLAFLNRFAHAVDVLERQMFARMTESGPKPRLTGQNCSVFMADIVGFGDPIRTDADRSVLIRVFYKAMEDVFERAGIAWVRCHDEDRGDGVLLIVPSSIPTGDVVHPLVDMLATRLRQHNKRVPRAQRMRLRVALNVGPVTENEHGVEGEAIINTARLMEASQLKEAVTRPGVDLVLIASQYVFESVVRHLPQASAYRPVDVSVKKFQAQAWIRVYRRRRG